MARSRSLPTNLFDDPDFFDLSSETQIVLVGLVLGADDAGRGLAHTSWLARKLNKAVQAVEESLCQLEERHLLLRYQVEHHSYYTLTKWGEWETLSKPTPSKLPAPPQHEGETPKTIPEFPQNPQENFGESGDMLREGEEEREREGEEEGRSNVVLFPAPTSDTTTVSQERIQAVTKQIALILKLAHNDALSRIVDEYLPDPRLSLLGEADAAREWIDDPRRNRKKQRMTPAFFRRWIKRELADNRHHHQQTQATGTTDRPVAASRSPAAGTSLMDLESRYQHQRSQAGKEPE